VWRVRCGHVKRTGCLYSYREVLMFAALRWLGEGSEAATELPKCQMILQARHPGIWLMADGVR
jgi:hypothetical protein